VGLYRAQRSVQYRYTARRETGLDSINRTDRIKQDKEYRLKCTGPRGQTGLCRTKMTDGITQGKDGRQDETGPRWQMGLDKINRTDRKRQDQQVRRDLQNQADSHY
jgi:hypothetical protein